MTAATAIPMVRRWRRARATRGGVGRGSCEGSLGSAGEESSTWPMPLAYCPPGGTTVRKAPAGVDHPPTDRLRIMPKMNREEVMRIAQLALIDLTEEELEKFAREMTVIV